jgi:site-specific DNA-cytosine methylase
MHAKSIDHVGMMEPYTKEILMKLTPKKFPNMRFSLEDFHASPLAMLAATSDLLTPEELSSLQLQKLSKVEDQRSSYLRTSKDFSPTTLAGLSSQFSIRWTNWGMMRNGVCITQKISESPKIENECTLQAILEKGIPWRSPKKAELDNSKSRGNGGPHRPIRFRNEVQKALTVQDAYRLLVGQNRNGVLQVRRHTIKECERLQGFPDGWTESVPESIGFKLLGNAVTTTVVQYVALKTIEDKLPINPLSISKSAA